MAANRRHEWTSGDLTWRHFLLPLSGQVLVCTVTGRVVDLDVVAERGPLPTGTPFLVVAVIPSDTLRALAEPVLARWMEERGPLAATMTCHDGLGRVMVGCSHTRINLNLRSITVPRVGAAA